MYEQNHYFSMTLTNCEIGIFVYKHRSAVTIVRAVVELENSKIGRLYEGVPKLSKFKKKIVSRAHGNFEQQTGVLESIIIIYYYYYYYYYYYIMRYNQCSKWKFRSAGILLKSERRLYHQKNRNI
jgi:hypothetical protein